MKWFIAIVLAVLFATPSWADSYYLMIFSHDSAPVPWPFVSHVWGTFVRVKGESVEIKTISWCPTTKWSIFDSATTGYNMTLYQSIEDAIRKKRKVCMWGPFAIDQSLYEKAERMQKTPGYYKCIDVFNRPNATNCIHKISDITGVKLTTHFRYGKCAGEAVYRHYSNLGLLKELNNEIVPLVGLERYEIRRITR